MSCDVDVCICANLTIVETSYNESKAIYLARLSSAAYCSPAIIEKWSCSPCKLVHPLENRHVVQNPHGDFQGIVGYNTDENAVVVAFRGSVNIQNWIDNFKVIKVHPFVQYPNVSVHHGFYSVFESISSIVVTEVRRLLVQYPSAQLTLTGTSLGGAIASLFALQFSLFELIPVHDLYTFGEPRVGDSNFTALLKTAVPQIYRVTNYRDPVPHVPQLAVGYEHSPQKVTDVRERLSD